GLDAVLLLRLTRDLSLMTAHQFGHEVLKHDLHGQEVHERYSFRFGHKASGDVSQLSEFGRELGFQVKEYPEMKLRGESVSSSHIRKLLSDGRVSRARHLLGRPFSILSTPAAAAAMAPGTRFPPLISAGTRNWCLGTAST